MPCVELALLLPADGSVSSRLPAAAAEHARIESVAAARAEVLAVPVLAPIRFARVPGDPQAVGPVAGQRHVGVIARRSRDLPALFQLPAGSQAPDEDVEIAVLVPVPADPHVSLGVGRGGGNPVVALTAAHANFFRPALPVPGLHENRKLAVAETLPDQVQLAARVAHDGVIE